MSITQINENIYRLTIPYKDVFTTVYTIRTPEGVALFDAASYDTDAEEYIIPFLQTVGVTAEELKYVFVSHNHGDHAGGLKGFLPFYPDVTVASRSPKIRDRMGSESHRVIVPQEGDILLGTLQVVTIPGHTVDSAALLDLRDHTMITGDCLQVHGIVGSQDWASNILHPAKYLAALEKVRKLPVKQLVTAHDYCPTGYRAEGREAVLNMIDNCEKPMRRLQKLILDNPEKDDLQIRELYNDTPNAPTIREGVVKAMRAAISEGEI